MKRSLLWASVLAVLPIVVGMPSAEEPELPRRMAPPPGMVLARTSPSGDLVLRMVDTEAKEVPNSVTGYKTVEKTVDGVSRKERVPFTETKTKTARVATGWRKVPIDQSVLYEFFDTKGVPVTREKAAERLTKETAVLLSEEPIESFHLLTAREDVLILVVPSIHLHLPLVIEGTAFSGNPRGPLAVQSALTADDPALPKQITFPPATALAQMSPQGELSLRLIGAEFKKVRATIPSYAISEKMVNGTIRKEETLIESVSGTRQALVPVGWRKASLKSEDPLIILDTKGNVVTKENAAKKLAKETPVLIHFEPVDPIQMSTAREDTLLFVVPMDMFDRMLFGQSFPAVPVGAPLPAGVKVEHLFVPDPDVPSGPAPKETASPPTQVPGSTAPSLAKPDLLYLETGFAQATDNDAVVIKLVEYDPYYGVQEAKYEPVNAAKSGETDYMKNFKINTFIATTPRPKKWRLLAWKRGEAGFAVHDHKGKAVPWEKALKMLEQETPVLVSATPIDPSKLLVMKEDVLVMVIPAKLIYPDFYRDMPESRLPRLSTPGTPGAPFAVPLPASAP